MRIDQMVWSEVEEYLRSDDRCVLPLGSTEQHAYISLGTDTILSGGVAEEAAEPLGVPVYPVLPYGITPYFMAYPGTVTISPNTYDRVLLEILGSVRRHGFRRILVVNGHGGNSPARPAVEGWAARKDGVQLIWHDWWRAPRVRKYVDSVDPDASHASWMETFPRTRVPGVTLPDRHKDPVDLGGRDDVSLSQIKEVLGDGSFGGWYERPPEVVQALWEIAVDETRDLLEHGWDS